MVIISKPNKIILADPQAISRAFTASAIGTVEDMRIMAQCDNLNQIYHAITRNPGSLVLFAASMQPDLARLLILLETIGSYGIVFSGDIRLADSYFARGISGVLPRGADAPAVIECVRCVAAGELWLTSQLTHSYTTSMNPTITQVRDQLTPNEPPSSYKTVLKLSMWVRLGTNEGTGPLLSAVDFRAHETDVQSSPLT